MMDWKNDHWQIKEIMTDSVRREKLFILAEFAGFKVYWETRNHSHIEVYPYVCHTPAYILSTRAFPGIRSLYTVVTYDEAIKEMIKIIKDELEEQ